MLPLGDTRERGGPAALITWSVLLLNVVAFFLELDRASSGVLQSFIQAWGVVPREYAAGRDLAPHIPLPFWTTLVTSMFLHGGWAHLFGNMLYLGIFGDNVERRLGHARFALFYLACGVAAALAHILFNARSGVPTVGASGAISGILGAYFVLFPRNRVRVMTLAGVTTVPAVTMLGLWILIQLASGLGAITDPREAGGVAYVAHVGGFLAGMLMLVLLGARRRRPALA
jgi:membrane associated rhomboid family serine protease